jgi:hypothetical protein
MNEAGLLDHVGHQALYVSPSQTNSFKWLFYSVFQEIFVGMNSQAN